MNFRKHKFAKLAFNVNKHTDLLQITNDTMRAIDKGVECSGNRTADLNTLHENHVLHGLTEASSGSTNHSRHILFRRYYGCTCWKEAESNEDLLKASTCV